MIKRSATLIFILSNLIAGCQAKHSDSMGAQSKVEQSSVVKTDVESDLESQAIDPDDVIGPVADITSGGMQDGRTTNGQYFEDSTIGVVVSDLPGTKVSEYRSNTGVIGVLFGHLFN